MYNYFAMSKLLIAIKSLDKIDNSTDGFVLGYEKYTAFSAHRFSYEEISSLKDKSNIYILMNALIHQNVLKDALYEVDRLVELGVNFIFQDIGLVHYLKKKNYQKDVLYFPYTLITNKDELLAFNKENITPQLSSYLNPQEYIDMSNNMDSIITVFGYVPLYQTYRPLLDLYDEKYQVISDKNQLFIKENERNELMRIIENEYGTFIFRGAVNNSLDILHYFKNVNYLYIDSLFVDDATFNEVIGEVRSELKK